MAKKKSAGTVEALPQVHSKVLSVDYPDTGLGLFSNHMLAQNAGTEFHLSFFQLQAPFKIGINEDGKGDRIVAQPVARIIVPPALIPSIIEVLQMHVTRAATQTSETQP